LSQTNINYFHITADIVSNATNKFKHDFEICLILHLTVILNY